MRLEKPVPSLVVISPVKRDANQFAPLVTSLSNRFAVSQPMILHPVSGRQSDLLVLKFTVFPRARDKTSKRLFTSACVGS